MSSFSATFSMVMLACIIHGPVKFVSARPQHYSLQDTTPRSEYGNPYNQPDPDSDADNYGGDTYPAPTPGYPDSQPRPDGGAGSSCETSYENGMVCQTCLARGSRIKHCHLSRPQTSYDESGPCESTTENGMLCQTCRRGQSTTKHCQNAQSVYFEAHSSSDGGQAHGYASSNGYDRRHGYGGTGYQQPTRSDATARYPNYESGLN